MEQLRMGMEDVAWGVWETLRDNGVRHSSWSPGGNCNSLDHHLQGKGPAALGRDIEWNRGSLGYDCQGKGL